MAASVIGLTVMVTVALFVHPLLVPVTEYIVVVAGVAENEDPDPDGAHEYVVAPPALMVVLAPLQMLVGVAEAVTVGTAFTVTVTVVLFVHPLLVPVTE